MHTRRSLGLALCLAAALAPAALPTAQAPARPAAKAAASPDVGALPRADGSVKFAAIGDSGTGGRAQQQIADRMVAARTVFPYTFVIMLGDNLYGRERVRDYEKKFEIPYAPLLENGVKFYASLGNHDDSNQRFYDAFNMGGQRYYTFTQGGVRFFALDSNYLDTDQVAWLARELQASTDKWKIAFFHHPLYSSGARHGSEVDLRQVLEPLFVAHGVSAVFAGHEHFYERIKPQKGITYFTNGGAAKLRRGNIRDNSAMTARGFDTDNSFMLIEIAGDDLHFTTIARDGRVVDSGVAPRVRTPAATAEPGQR